MKGFLNILTESAINNNLLVFVGAGASIGEDGEIGLPSGQKLNNLLKSAFYEEDETDGLSFESAAEFLEGKYGRRTLIDKISEIIKKVEHPVNTHRLISELPFEIVVTTNYDDLIEKALTEIGKEHLTITCDTDLINLSKSAIKVFKIHGCINTKSDDIIISEKDYYEKFLLSSYLFVDILKSWLTTHTCLFIGYSLSDINIKHLFFDISKRLGITNIKGRFFAVQYSPTQAEINLWEKRGFVIIKSDQNAFLNDLIDEIEFNAWTRDSKTLIAKKPIRIGKLSARALKTTEQKTGADEQRFIHLSKRKVEYLGMKDGEWALIEVNDKKEYVKVFSKNSNTAVDIKFPLTVRNLLNIKGIPPLVKDIKITKAQLSPIQQLPITQHDLISLLPIEFDRIEKVVGKPVVTIRNLEFELLSLKEGDALLIKSENAKTFEKTVFAYKFNSNPGRALIGVNSTLKDHLDELDIDYHHLILERLPS